MRTVALTSTILAALLLAACGGDDSAPPASVPSTPSPTPTPPPAPTPTPTATAPRITIEFGNAQSVNQHQMLARPLQVRLYDSQGRGVPGVRVVFIASQNNGRNSPDFVTTDSLGIGTWLPGSFHNPGLQTVRASAEGYGSVDFAVQVAATTFDYDGTYTCSSTSAIRREPFSFPIVSDVLIWDRNDLAPPFAGFFVRSTLTITGSRGNDAARQQFTGQASLEPNGSATISGTFIVTSVTAPGDRIAERGTWSCLRE